MECTSVIVAAAINAKGGTSSSKTYTKWITDMIEVVHEKISKIENGERIVDSRNKQNNIEELNRELFAKRRHLEESIVK